MEKTAESPMVAAINAPSVPLAGPSTAMSSPPRFWFVFDWKLVVSLLLLGLIGLMSCDVVNAKLDQMFAEKSGTVPDPSTWKAGALVDVEITLITKDEGRLDCSDDRDLAGAHCAFKKNRTRWPVDPSGAVDDNRVDVIQPYRTAVGNHLVMVAGMWATPALALRLHQESPRGVAETELKRFVARCQLEFLGELTNLDVRWGTTSEWYAEKVGPIARAKWCTIPKSDE